MDMIALRIVYPNPVQQQGKKPHFQKKRSLHPPPLVA